VTLVTRAHTRLVAPRRVRVLAGIIEGLIPRHASVLDLGAGDGLLAHQILQTRPDLSIRGLDVLLRPSTHIQVDLYDGLRVPAPDASVDYTLLVDVLHHASAPGLLLREATRVSRQGVVIKDHLAENVLDEATLRLMDWVGNAGHGVHLTYSYWPRARWLRTFADLHLEPVVWRERLGLYPFPASVVFGRGLHFVTRLEPGRREEP
jgi:SAM-dependent methyltransferase